MRYRRALVLLGLLLMAWGQHNLLTDYANLPDGLVPIGLGLAAVAAAAWGTHLPNADAGSQNRPTGEHPRLRWPNLLLLAGSILLTILAGLCAHQWHTVTTPVQQLALWVAALMMLLAGTAQPGELRQRWDEIRAAWHKDKATLLILAAATLVGLLARTIALSKHPYPFSFDEGAFAHEAAAIGEGFYNGNPFGPAWLSHPRLFHYWIAPWIAWLGRTVLAARLPVALLGTLTIPAVYFLGRELYGKRAGLAAALFLAGFNFHIHFSRLTLNNVVDPMFGALAFAFLLRGMRRSRLSDFAAAGIALGLSQYFYAGSRLLPLIMIAWMVCFLFTRRDLLPGRLAGVAILLLGLLITTWPADWFLLSEGQPLTTRLSSTGLFQTGRYEVMLETQTPLQILWYQVKHSTLALIHTLDATLFYGQVAPVMGRYAGVPFLLGGLYAALRPRRIESWLPFLWIGSTIAAGGILLSRPPGYARYVLMIPAAAVLVGLGITATIDLLQIGRERFRRWFPVGIAAGLMAVEIAFYVGVYVPHPQTYGRDPNTLLGDAVISYLQEQTAEEPGLRIYYMLLPRMHMHNATLTMYFLPYIADTDLPPGLAEIPPEVDRVSESLFIISPERYEADATLLTTQMPGGTMQPILASDGSPLFYAYHVSPLPGP